MVRIPTKLTPRGNSQAVTIPREAMEAAGLKQGDELALIVRDDGDMEIHRASADDAALDESFEWALGRYGRTFEDLAR
jgi:antitoxin component of MazEF toxin-antitoxin module